MECRVDWDRRFDHMQQHTGQHLLSAVLLELYGVETVGFHLGAESSTIDISATALDPDQVARRGGVRQPAGGREPPGRGRLRSGGSEAQGLRRRPSERDGVLRIVSIEGLDRSPCGGTHVRATAEIGPVLIRKLDKIRGNVRDRIPVRACAPCSAPARTSTALSRIAKVLSAPLDDSPSLVAAQRDPGRGPEGPPARRHRAGPVSRAGAVRGTAAGTDGVRHSLRRQAAGALDDEAPRVSPGLHGATQSRLRGGQRQSTRCAAGRFGGRGLHAGELLKTALAKFGGRGGGSALLAQGSVESVELLERLLADLGAC